MALEYKLPYTASQISTKLGKIDSLALKSEVPSKLSDLDNDVGYVTEVPNEIYIGDGNMPEGATIQILTDNSDESQALKEELKDFLRQDLQEIKDSGAFDGKSAYAYAKEKGYTGTEEEFAAEVANYVNLNAENAAIRALVENIVIPTKTSELINDSNFVTADNMPEIDVSGEINTHNEDINAHPDIRSLVDNITAADIGAAPAYSYGTEDLVDGESVLETGMLYFVYV